MTTAKYDVTGIGNAIVDVLARSTDEFLASHQMTKGGMALIDAAKADQLYSELTSAIEQSGGSVANTMAGIASLGGRGAYIGKVRNDALGEAFASDMRLGGTHFETAPLKQGAGTARCIILVTPDAQRTMNTFLGASVELTPADIDPVVIQQSQVTYLEGYLFDPPHAKQAFIRAAELAHAAGREVALSLSDSFCVARHRAEFLDLVHQHIDILFANEHEITSLYECDSFDQAMQQVRGRCKVAALTRSAAGSVIVSGEQAVEVGAAPVRQVLDTTGAGDLYAAGFLYAYTRGRPLAHCGRLGAIAAAEVISHFGARPETDLKELAREWL
ncbi:MAG: hypothetical protein RJA70_1387 [Pseudomonadota bacterium]|jgi:sugar/nucleoside kinase (ribokinase family)